MAANQLNVTELDFDKIKENFIQFLKGQSQFNDYNFEGSGMSILLDILAYNTHYNAMGGHIDVNESFLRSAQIRHNVVGAARPLGYVPRSALGATIPLNITINNPIGSPPPVSINMERGSVLTSTVDGQQYQFTILETVNAALTQQNTYEFKNIVAHQGELRKIIHRVDNTVENQRFVIPDRNVDTTSIRVRVKQHDESQSFEVYSLFTTFGNITADTTIYFTEELSTGEYAVYFGDGIIGKKPTTNNIVEIEYLVTKGSKGNGANQFIFASDIGGNTDIDVAVSIPGSKSSGGADQEGIESIRFNAPLTFIAQNRAVTADDYKSLLIKEYGDIEAISTWGGEDNFPPDYGKVYIAIKPKSGDNLTPLAKTNITNILKGRNVVSISPVFVDPDFTFLEVEVFFKYNPNLTNSTRAELQALVKSTIEQYNSDYLRDFSGVFRYSQLLREIDLTNVGILNSTVRVYMFKNVELVANADNAFDISFAGSFFIPVQEEISIKTTPIKINGVDHFIGDEPLSDTERQLFIYRVVDEKPLKVIKDVGRMNPSEGSIRMYGFRPDENTTLKFTIAPLSFDIAPKRNQLIEIDSQSIQIVGEVDTIATAGAGGANDYETTARQ